MLLLINRIGNPIKILVEMDNGVLRTRSYIGCTDFRKKLRQDSGYTGSEMMQPAFITTPIPTVDEVAERLGISKARKKAIIRIMTGERGPKSSGSGRKIANASKAGSRKNSRDKKSAKRVSKRA